MEVQGARGGALRRPRVEGAPTVAARLEDGSLRLREATPVLQIVGEERRLDLLAIIFSRGGAEVDLAELLAGPVGPASVPPRPHDEIILVRRVVLLQLAVDRDGAVEILLVPPASHIEGGHGDACEVRPHRLPLPEAVVIGMLGEIRPSGQPLLLEHFRLDVRERAEAEVPFVGVVAAKVEVGVLLRGLGEVRVLEAVAQPECAVVVEVVADEHVGGRGLRAHGAKRGMRTQHAHRRGPSVVADAQHAHAPIVLRRVLEQPLDGVPGVGAFIDGLRRGIHRPRRTLHDERALALVATANVLEHEDIALFREIRVARGKPFRRTGHAVRRALEEEGQRRLGVRRPEDLDVELESVTHGDVGGRMLVRSGIVLRFRLLRPCGNSGGEREQDGKKSHGITCGRLYAPWRGRGTYVGHPALCQRIASAPRLHAALDDGGAGPQIGTDRAPSCLAPNPLRGGR